MSKHRKMAATFTHRRPLLERVYLQFAVAAANSMIEGFRRIQVILGPLAPDPHRPRCKPRKARRIRRRRAKAQGRQNGYQPSLVCDEPSHWIEAG